MLETVREAWAEVPDDQSGSSARTWFSDFLVPCNMALLDRAASMAEVALFLPVELKLENQK